MEFFAYFYPQKFLWFVCPNMEARPVFGLFNYACVCRPRCSNAVKNDSGIKIRRPIRSKGIVPSCSLVLIVPSERPSALAASLRVRKAAFGGCGAWCCWVFDWDVRRCFAKSPSISSDSSFTGITTSEAPEAAFWEGCVLAAIMQKRQGCNILSLQHTRILCLVGIYLAGKLKVSRS